MRSIKVVESATIDAPLDRVYRTIVNCDRRLQLSPLWGVTRIEYISPDFPSQGSSYLMVPTAGNGPGYETVVTANIPQQRFSYQLSNERQTAVTWTFQDAAGGTRLIYDEQFLVDDAGEDELVSAVRDVVRRWLLNIKRYLELGDTRWERLVRWLLDRYILSMRVDQRRVIALLVGLQAISGIAFVLAALGFAIANLLF